MNESEYKKIKNKHYISKFEEEFSEWVEDLSLIVAQGGEVHDLAHSVQALINAYHEERGGLLPSIPKINTLKLFILISGASEAYTRDNEDLKILQAAAIKKSNI